MTEHQTQQQAQQQTQPPPSAPSRTDVRALNQLRRSSSDSYLGGVAGGLGRHLDVDPTVIRVALVVLTFFGGAGLLLYVALWLFVPLDTKRRAAIRISPDSQAYVVIGALVLAAVVFVSTTFGNNGWGFGFPVVVVLVIATAVWLAVKDRRDTRARAAAYPPPPVTDPSGAAMSTTETAPTAAYPTSGPTYAGASGYDAPPPPAWAPPRPPAPLPPPRPRRTGLVLFWPTLALIAIALGVLGIVDASSTVPLSAYAALAVAITGAMLVVGAFVGRAGGLILLGLLTSFVMLVSSGVQAATGGATGQRSLEVTPTVAAAVDREYAVQNGDIRLDLSGVTDPQALGGRITEVRLNAGEIRVVLPRTVDVHVVADLRYAGHVEVAGQVREGFGPRLDTTVPAATPGAATSATTPTYELVVNARVGSIVVEQD